MKIKDLDIEHYPQSHVLVEGEWIPVSVTEFLNISEDIHGRDVMTFTYGGKVYESLVIMK
jgi:hypothetical protein